MFVARGRVWTATHVNNVVAMCAIMCRVHVSSQPVHGHGSAGGVAGLRNVRCSLWRQHFAGGQ